jgi:hypothetical protein
MTDTQDTAERDQKRRTILESLHLQQNTPGRLAEGLKETDHVLVASFNNPAVGQQFKRELSAVGITSWLKPDGIKTSVEVAYRDRSRAFERFADFHMREPDEVQVTTRRPLDFAILGCVLGAIAGIISLRYSFPLRVLVWAAFIFNGAFLGYVLDPGRRQRRSGASGQFSLFDLLLLTAAIAVLFASLNFLFTVSAELGEWSKH